MAIKWVDYDCKIMHPISEVTMIGHIERAYRICYNSELKMDTEVFSDAVKFIQEKIKAGHHSPLEHSIITMKSTMDRGIMAELTRHRIGSSFSVQSTRYIAYKDDIECIMPNDIRNAYEIIKNKFIKTVEDSCHGYQELLKNKVAPQNARAVLPMCLKTELIHSHNVRELFHILDLRYFCKTGKAHPDMRYWCHKMYLELQKYYPNIFTEKALEI